MVKCYEVIYIFKSTVSLHFDPFINYFKNKDGKCKINKFPIYLKKLVLVINKE